MDLSVRINNQGLWVLVTVDLVSVFEIVIVIKTVSHPCLVTVSSCALRFLSWSLFVLFHLPIPPDYRTVLAQQTLLLTKVKELQFYGVSFPLPFFLHMENESLTSALFSWQEKWVAPVCWPAIVPDGYLFRQPVVVCQFPLTGCCSENLWPKSVLLCQVPAHEFLLVNYGHNSEFVELLII